jgi:cephalosporin hydroxylase
VINIDEARGLITLERDGERTTCGWDTPQGFGIVSDLWLRAGWAVKHVYTFSWLGIPIIQLPEDMVRIQELIYRIRPDVIIETGVAHGGSLIFYASLCHLLGKGRVIGVEIDLRPNHRTAIEAHPLFSYITLIDGDSTTPDAVAKVTALIQPHQTVLVVLDSNHTKAHVLKELQAYAPLVSVDSYVIATDGGIMELVTGGPRAAPDWDWDNPKAAAQDFAQHNSEFICEEPPFLFNEGFISQGVSYWKGGYLKRIR